jgi:hypothetical protein
MSSTKLRLLGVGAAVLVTTASLPPSFAGTDRDKPSPSTAQNADGESNKGNGGVIVDRRKIKAPNDAQVILGPDTANGGSNIGNGGTTGRGNANGGSNNGNGGVVIDGRTIERQASKAGPSGKSGESDQPAGRTITLPWGGKVFVPGLHADGESNVGNGRDGTVIGQGSAKGGKNNGRDGIGLNGGSAKGGSGNGNGGVVIDNRRVSGKPAPDDDKDD